MSSDIPVRTSDCYVHNRIIQVYFCNFIMVECQLRHAVKSRSSSFSR